MSLFSVCFNLCVHTRHILCFQITNLFSSHVSALPLTQLKTYMQQKKNKKKPCTLTNIPTHSVSAEEKLQSHKPVSVWTNASSPKLYHSVFDGTRCTSIKEIERLTASQIKALNLSICLVSVLSRAGEKSERERDYRGEILGWVTDRWEERETDNSCSLRWRSGRKSSEEASE